MLKNYEVGFTYKVEEFGAVTLQALNADEADDLGREHVYTAFPEATDITVDYVKEVNTNNG